MPTSVMMEIASKLSVRDRDVVNKVPNDSTARQLISELIVRIEEKIRFIS